MESQNLQGPVIEKHLQVSHFASVRAGWHIGGKPWPALVSPFCVYRIQWAKRRCCAYERRWSILDAYPSSGIHPLSHDRFNCICVAMLSEPSMKTWVGTNIGGNFRVVQI